MLLSEVIDYVITSSGQFYFLLTEDDPLSCFGFTIEKFWKTLARHQLIYYQRYRPLTFRFNRTLSSVGHLGQAFCMFGTDSASQADQKSDHNKVWDNRVPEFNRDPLLVPRWISDVHPTITLATAGIFYLLQISSFLNTGEYSRLREPRKYCALV